MQLLLEVFPLEVCGYLSCADEILTNDINLRQWIHSILLICYITSAHHWTSVMFAWPCVTVCTYFWHLDLCRDDSLIPCAGKMGHSNLLNGEYILYSYYCMMCWPGSLCTDAFGATSSREHVLWVASPITDPQGSHFPLNGVRWVVNIWALHKFTFHIRLC